MKNKASSKNKESLRSQAEQRLREGKDLPGGLASRDKDFLIQELRTVQIELEMQNEELRAAQQEIEASRRTYADLYDFAPIAYFTLDREGLIRSANIAGASLLGTERSVLIGKAFSLFIAPADEKRFDEHRMSVAPGEKCRPCEVRIRRRDGSLMYAELRSTGADHGVGAPGGCRMALSDISERKVWEQGIRESEESYRSLVESAPESICVQQRGYFVYLNKAALKLFGAVSIQEVAGKKTLDCIHPDFRDSAAECIRQVEEEGVQGSLQEVRILGAGGQVIDVEAVMTPATYDGEPAIQMSLKEIKESNNSELTLLLQATVLSQVSDAVLAIGNDRRIIFWNKGAERLYKVSAANAIGRKSEEICRYRWSSPDQERTAREEIAANGFLRGENIHILGTGEEIYVESSASVLTGWSGAPAGWLAVMRDITERKEAENELKKARNELELRVRERTAELSTTLEALQSEFIVRRRAEKSLRETGKLLENVFANIHVAIAYMDTRFDFIRVNQNFGDREGQDPAFYPGKNYFTLFPDPENEKIFRRVVETGAPHFAFGQFLKSRERPDWGATYWDWSLAPVKEPHGSVSGVVLSAVDVTERKRAEMERMRLVAAIEAAAEAVVITEPNGGTIQYVNRAFEQITGFSKQEATGQTLHILESGKHDEEYYQKMREAISRNGFWKGRLINKKKDGTLYYEECTYSQVKDESGALESYISIKDDVTEKLRLESIAEAVDTMNNIGYAFSGIRHEIGNPISSLLIILGLIRKKFDSSPKEVIRGYVEQAVAQVERVEYLLTSLKNFNMYENLKIANVQVAAFIEKFINLVIQDLTKKGVSLNVDVAPGIKFMTADPRALQQALLNIVVNAADAVTGRPDPKISLEAGKGRGMIRIRVADNGAGIHETRQKELFKPFYTSKAQGTGLGLVITKKLISRMNGLIEIASRVDEGTIVDIYIPEGALDD